MTITGRKPRDGQEPQAQQGDFFPGLLATWDGLVSNLRTYPPKELDDLVAESGVPGYRWQSGRSAGGATRLAVTYLLGLPEHAEAGSHR